MSTAASPSAASLGTWSSRRSGYCVGQLAVPSIQAAMSAVACASTTKLARGRHAPDVVTLVRRRPSGTGMFIRTHKAEPA